MKPQVLSALVSFTAIAACAQQFTIVPSNGLALITFSNQHQNGISTLEGRDGRKWVPLENFFTTQQVGQVELPLPTNYSTLRVCTLPIEAGAIAKLALGYGDITTVAGFGPVVPPGTNAWLPEFEGAPATFVPFSNPRALVADKAGNIFVVEKDSHAVTIIDATNGTYRTAIGPLDFYGARQPGYLAFDPGFEAPATLIPLRNPTGLFYSNEKIYVLDSGNGQVLRYSNGWVRPLFTETNGAGIRVGITNGAGLWVSPDETEAFYTDGTVLKHWEAGNGIEIFASGFVDLAAVTADPMFQLIVVDHGGNRVSHAGNTDMPCEVEVLAGNGLTVGPRSGDARRIALPGPTSISYLPIGGYLIGTDQGTGVWYVDAGGKAAPLISGAPGAHAGDGDWFRAHRTRPKISHVQSLTVAPSGDILLLEGGYVRRIKFLRHKP